MPAVDPVSAVVPVITVAPVFPAAMPVLAVEPVFIAVEPVWSDTECGDACCGASEPEDNRSLLHTGVPEWDLDLERERFLLLR